MSSTVATVTDALRGCYEAFVYRYMLFVLSALIIDEQHSLWMFFNLMVSFFGGEAMLLEKLNDGRPPTKHLWPLDRYLRPMHVDFLSFLCGMSATHTSATARDAVQLSHHQTGHSAIRPHYTGHHSALLYLQVDRHLRRGLFFVRYGRSVLDHD